MGAHVGKIRAEDADTRVQIQTHIVAGACDSVVWIIIGAKRRCHGALSYEKVVFLIVSYLAS